MNHFLDFNSDTHACIILYKFADSSFVTLSLHIVSFPFIHNVKGMVFNLFKMIFRLLVLLL